MKVAIHSFKGGTGKSTLCANLAAFLALRGKRVGVVDHDLTAPGIHVIFNVPEESLKYKINDLLWGRCQLKEVVTDLTKHLKIEYGKLYFIPASLKTGDIMRILNEGYDPVRLTEIFKEIVKSYDLDFLIVDTHPGISEDVLLTMVACNPIIVTMRFDKQDFTGTAITLEVTRRFGRHAELLINMVPEGVPEALVKEQAEKAFNQPVMAVVPFYIDLLSARSGEVFALTHMNHPFTKTIDSLSQKLIAMKETMHLPSL